MGLFSKKTMICVRCGKTFQTRLGFDVCDDCIQKQMTAEDEVKGYVKYAKVMQMPQYTESQLKEIPVHREKILNSCKKSICITKEEVIEKTKRFSKLNSEQATEFVSKVIRSSVILSKGTSITTRFFTPTAFERTIVDAKDVYAVAYTGKPSSRNGYETLICAVFTNDPYIPVFPYACEVKVGFFELVHSKEGRKETEDFFTNMCPNLKYPVLPLKDFKKTIKGSDDPNKSFILEMLSNVDSSWGIFANKYLTAELSDSTKRWLEDAGYILDAEIAKILKLTDSFRGAI